MGMFDGLKNELANLEKLTPEAIVADLESVKADVANFESRIAVLENGLTTLQTLANNVAPILEAAVPSATPEITAALALLKAFANTAPSLGG